MVNYLVSLMGIRDFSPLAVERRYTEYKVGFGDEFRHKDTSNYSKFSSASFAFRSASASRSAGTATCSPFVSLLTHDISSSNSFSLLSSWTRYILGEYQQLERG